ncbi:MAG: DegT/DnrJ/EryC1/StrS family aminotransferase [Gammaproteobacteria bacterium]|nr:DegT/DnrJ/EryC1/StrS family aminotransferase [Gammaproteobacteria bacterium]
MIPMVDLKQQYAALKPQLDERIAACLASGHFVLGPEGKAFEHEISHYLNCKHALGLASGTDALILALRAIGVQPGDEVITTPFTFMATAGAICLVGATPVFVDIDPHTYNIDPNHIEAAITSATRAIIPVHLFGQAADMTAIMALANKHSLRVIEDCAQSIGATWEGKMTGSFGDIACYSFFPSKNLGCFGDGGLVSTNRDDLAQTLSALRNHGSHVRYYHDMLGYNSRLDELQAVILRTKLPHIDIYNAQRRQVAEWYNEALRDLPVTLPSLHPHALPVYHQYTLLSEQRDFIMQQLTQASIANAVYYPIPLHRQHLFGNRYQHLSLPHSERIAQQCFSLPIFPEMTKEQVDQVTHVIRQALS